MKTNPSVLSRRLGDEVVLYHLETDRFYELNGTAARFWELLNEGNDQAQAREKMLAEFAVDGQQFDGEVANFVSTLRGEDLIRVDE